MEKKYITMDLSQLDIGLLSTSTTAPYISFTPYNSNSISILDISKQESSIEEDIKNNIKPRLVFTDLDTNEKLSIYDNLEIRPTITIDKIKEVVNNTLTDDLNSYYIKAYPITLGHSMQPGTGLIKQIERTNMHKY